MKRFLIGFIVFSLIVFFTFAIILPLPGYVPVLMYHFIYPKTEINSSTSTLNVAVEGFRAQMWLLKILGFRTVSLDEYYEIKAGLRKPRGKEVLITFDDGHHAYLDYALPILERYQFKSTNFLIWMWLTNGNKAYISLSEAKELAKNPLVTFGAHTMTHRILTDISSLQAKDEIIQSKDYLEKAFRMPFHYFAFPAGMCNPMMMKVAQEAGYRLAFTTSRKRLNGYPETLYSLIRIKVSPKYNLFIFWIYVSGLHHYGLKIKDKFLQLTGVHPSDKLSVYRPDIKTP